MARDDEALIELGARSSASDGAECGSDGETSTDAPTRPPVCRELQDLKVARALFFGGFALLPWLWCVVWLHFRKPARAPSADPRLAWYVWWSGFSAACGAVLFVAWVATVQLSWRSWDYEWQRSMMLVAPEEL